MPLVVPGYTLQDVALKNINSVSFNRVGGGDFSVSYGFDVEDGSGAVRETLSFNEVLSGSQLTEVAALVAARLPAINAFWPGAV